MFEMQPRRRLAGLSANEKSGRRKGGPGSAGGRLPKPAPLFFFTALTEFICRIKVHLAAERLFSGGHIWRSCEGVCLKKGGEEGEGRGASLQCAPHCTDFTYSALPTELSCLPGSLISKEHHSFLQLEEKWWRWCGVGGGNFLKVDGAMQLLKFLQQ